MTSFRELVACALYLLLATGTLILLPWLAYSLDFIAQEAWRLGP